MDSSSTKVNPDLAKERAKASFNVLELTYLLYGGQQKTERKRYLESLLTSDPVFSKEDAYILNREHAYERTLQKGLHLVKAMKKHNITDIEDIRMLRRLVGSSMPYDLHHGMFIPTIKSQGTEEQRAKWLPLSETFQIIGTYGQTEMGHGTYVRGLQTTATYDKETQEFVIHSPSLSACKWWPGCLGKTCTHAVIAAKLVVDGNDHGIQMFIVQLRDLHSHQPLPGIKIGEIGPKFSMVIASDNGYLMFDHVRIPRDQMLMGLAKLSPDGVLSKPPHPKAVYGTMSFVRAVIVIESFEELSKAITIAVRYSAVRRQGELRSGEPEPQIIDYKTQQYKLLPGLASAYALHFIYDQVWCVFREMQTRIGTGDYSMLPEVHALTSGLKAFSTSLAMHHAETCRLACGGHGCLLYSGITDRYAKLNASCTYEGDNDVLYLQVARYLMKCASKVRNGEELPPSLAFLSKTPERCPASSPREFLDPCVQRTMFQHKTASEIMTTANKMKAKIQAGLDAADAWNELSVDLLRCAKGYSNYVAVLFLLKSMEKLSGISHKLRLLLKALADLFVLWSVLENSGSFLEAGVLDSNQIRAVREQVYYLMEQLRPEAVCLVDAFDYSDYQLNSALGRYDGNVYEELFKCAQRSSLNKHEVLPSYYKYLRPLMQSHKAKL